MKKIKLKGCLPNGDDWWMDLTLDSDPQDAAEEVVREIEAGRVIAFVYQPKKWKRTYP